MSQSYRDVYPDAAADGQCATCRMPGLAAFYEVAGVPLRSGNTARTRAEAISQPSGDISLARCPGCGVITNLSFDSALLHLPPDAATEHTSTNAFDAFHYRLATELISRHRLHRKTIAEIGCGKGDFLRLLCEFGDNKGIGFDPSFRSGEARNFRRDRITFIPDRYLDRYADYSADFICCKMTLERVRDTVGLISAVRRSIRDRTDVVAFFMVENVRRVLRDVAFWDINYERCSLFDREALGNLFRLHGFDVLKLWSERDGRFLMIEARPMLGSPVSNRRNGAISAAGSHSGSRRAVTDTGSDVLRFARSADKRISDWRTALGSLRQRGERVVVWGADSRAVGFLTTVSAHHDVECVVDSDRIKQGTFLAGSGHEIVAPEALSSSAPDLVIVTNPDRRSQIERDLGRLGLSPDLVDVDLDPINIIESRATLFT